MLSRNCLRSPVFLKILILVVIVPIGFYTKFYRGPLQEWVNYSLGDILYEIFWCIVISVLLPRMKVIRIVLLIFLITSLLEFMQLWHPPLLETIRKTFLGRTFIGNYFVWSDFIYYITGCIVSYFLLIAIDRQKSESC